MEEFTKTDFYYIILIVILLISEFREYIPNLTKWFKKK